MRGSLACACLLLSARCALAQHWFDAVSAYPEAAQRPFIALGDLDQDGDVDLVQNPTGSLHAWLHTQKGEIASGPVSALAWLPPNASPYRALLRDFDGDVRVDLAYPSQVVGGLSGIGVQDGLGGGAFGAGVQIPTGFVPNELVAGDVNGDGIADIGAQVASGASPHVSWKMHGATGWSTSALAPLPPKAFPTNYWGSVVALELSGDARTDLAVSWGGEVLFYATHGVNPNLATKLTLPSAFGTPRCVAGDFDGDADDDLVAISEQSTLQKFQLVLLRQHSTGAFALGVSQTNVSVGFEPTAGDWDADGDLDLLGYGYPSNALVWKNDGQGDFSSGLSKPSGTVGLPGAAVDFDIDGHLDLVGQYFVVFGGGTYGDVAGPTVPDRAVVLDLEGEGDLDVLELGESSVDASGETLLSNDGAGAFSAATVALPTAPPTQHWGQIRSIADLDGDGALDAFVSSYAGNWFLQVHRLAGDGVGRFVASSPASHPGWMPPTVLPLLGDPDADGDVDMLEPEGWYMNDGAGFLGSFVHVDSLGYVARETGDWDADGDLDLIASTLAQPFATGLLIDSGGMAYVAAALPIALSPASALIDLDEDGDDDIVCEIASNHTLALIESASANPTLWPSTEPLWPSLAGPLAYDARDVDGDGRSDLVLSTTFEAGAPNLTVLRRNGPGLSYDAPRAWIVPGPVRAIADLDADGDVDALCSSVVRNVAADRGASGSLRQYGAGSAGANGVTPVLGAIGPLAIGANTELRLRWAQSNALAWLAIAGADAQLVDVPVVGATLWLDPSALAGVFAQPLVPTGTGQLGFTLPIAIDAALAGVHAYTQAYVLDAAASGGVCATNGLELTFGQ